MKALSLFRNKPRRILALVFISVGFYLLAQSDDGNNKWRALEEAEENNDGGVQSPSVDRTDLIMSHNVFEAPIVLKEFKLIYFPTAKAACSEMKYLISKIMGIELEEAWHVHLPDKAHFNHLHEYSNIDVQDMMTSDEWTKAVFVREPKERILSAFLDKFCSNKKWYGNHCCIGLDKQATEECWEAMHDQNFHYFLKRTKDCQNEHWDKQTKRIDEKWWPYINFIGYMDNLEADARKLLESLVSTEDGYTAWEKWGKTGWGKDGTQSFLHRDVAVHATHSHDKLKKYYTNPCDEKFVEINWAEDFESPHFTLNKASVHDIVPNIDFEKECTLFDKY